jgi:hypothetical protein
MTGAFEDHGESPPRETPEIVSIFTNPVQLRSASSGSSDSLIFASPGQSLARLGKA